MNAAFSIDTSALLSWYIRRYPPDVFPGLLPFVEGLIQAGRLRASEYVLTELGGKKDPLYDWAARQNGFFVKTDQDVLRRAAGLMRKHPLLVDPNALRPIQACQAESLHKEVSR